MKKIQRIKLGVGTFLLSGLCAFINGYILPNPVNEFEINAFKFWLGGVSLLLLIAFIISVPWIFGAFDDNE